MGARVEARAIVTTPEFWGDKTVYPLEFGGLVTEPSEAGGHGYNIPHWKLGELCAGLKEGIFVIFFWSINGRVK